MKSTLIFLLTISNYLANAQINTENNEEMKRRVLNLLNEQQQVIKVQQSSNVGTDLLGPPTSLLCPPCTLPTFKCVEVIFWRDERKENKTYVYWEGNFLW